jgi:ketosteroid isomerase-like protein
MRSQTVFDRILAGCSLCLVAASALPAQTGPAVPGAPPSSLVDPLAGQPSAGLLTQPALTPGALVLMDLERRFAAAVATGGGKVYASWFADDAVSLGNGRAPLLGRAAIAASATWDPKIYRLTWTPDGARMGPSNDMGFTWGTYEGRSTDAHGEPIIVTGRYINLWKRSADGAWKVAMDASAQEPPATGDCCALPKP